MFSTDWFIIASIVMVAVASPGPDFIITLRNSIVHSRRAGVFTALGIGLGTCVHVTYCILGIAALIAHSVMLFQIIKYLGAAYLVYIGIKALRSKGYDEETQDPARTKILSSMGAFAALRSGFLTNLLNPKATMFFFALFTQVIDPHTSVNTQILYGVTAAVISILWFSMVAVVLTDPRIKGAFLRFSKWIDRITGGLLIALGVKLALTKG